VICFYFRYLESCSIPALKRKCKFSANTSSSSSEDDKQVQQSQQEVEALEGNTKYTDNHNRTVTTDLFFCMQLLYVPRFASTFKIVVTLTAQVFWLCGKYLVTLSRSHN